MVKKIVSLLMIVSMILSLSLPAFASEDGIEIIDKADEQISVLPEILPEEIKDEGSASELAVEPIERGAFNLTQIHYLERTTGTVNFNNWKPDNFTDCISGRVYNASGDPRDEAILQFTSTAAGLNDDDAVILKVAARAQAALGVGATVRIVGIVDESYVYGSSFPTVDKNYVFTTDKLLTLDFTEFSFDVTPYVKARLAAGQKKISFLVELVDSDWKSGDSSVYMDLAVATYNVLPTLTYKDTPLTELSYDGKDIAIKEGQKVYSVMLTDGSLPVVAASANNATVEVTQPTEVPGSAVISVKKYGTETKYKVNFITPDYLGTATTTGVFYATRNTTNLRHDAALTQNNLSNTSGTIQVRTDSSTRMRQEGAVTFDVKDLLGITSAQKIVLTVYGSGNAAAINAGTKVAFRGITGEGISAGGKYGTDMAYYGESDNGLSSDANTAYKIDVTDYVKSKIEAGEETVSFALRVAEGGNATTFYWYYGGDKKATLTVEEISTELTDIKVDGVSLEDFSPSKTAYTCYVADDFVGIPAITVTKKDADASQYIELPDVIPGTAIVEISNPVGKTTTYTVKLKYESSKTNPTTYVSLPYVTYKNAANDQVIKALTSGVKVKAELNLKNLKDAGDITFVTALYNDGFLVDKISKKKTGSETMLVNTLDVTLTDVSKATVKSFILTDYESGQNVINCAQLNSSDNFIKSLTMSGYDFTEFDPEVTSYTINVPASVLNYPEFLSIPRASGTKIETVVPVYLSGAVTLKATADNGDEKTYTININRADAKITNATMAYPKFDGVNKKITIIENIANPVYNPVPSNPPTEGKNQGPDFNKEYALANCQNPVVFLTDRANYWIASMDERFNGASLVALPFDGIKPGDNTLMADYTAKTGFIEFDINRSATVYVFHANSGVPSWATAEGFTAVTDLAPSYVFEGTTDGSVNMTAMATAYSKYYAVDEWSEEPVTVSLGSISGHQYWWIIVLFDK